MRPPIMTVFFMVFFASATLALLKLAGIINWCWLAVAAPLLSFYVLFGVAMYCFSRRHNVPKDRDRKR